MDVQLHGPKLHNFHKEPELVTVDHYNSMLVLLNMNLLYETCVTDVL
jgi:hypothetical protein